MKKPLVLAILDGYGLAPPSPGNAIAKAKTPTLDRLFSAFSVSKLNASGLSVGLPEGQMGNSEVGHTNIGAGRVVYQDLTRISKSIIDGDFDENPAFLAALASAKEKGGRVHLMGLLGDGGVHSHITHLHALLKLCAKKGQKPVVHCFLDGRDVSPTSGAGFLQSLLDFIADEGIEAEIGVVSGRYYAMDRDNRFERLILAYNALTAVETEVVKDPVKAIEDSYQAGVTDEFVIPVICEGYEGITASDSVIFYNFRPDRAREITRALVDEQFEGFQRAAAIKPHFVCMSQYDEQMPNVSVAFAPQALTDIFGEYISSKGLTQLRIAETEKYAHVTFFFNGGEEKVFKGEERALIPSPKVATYDLQPEMSAFAVADECAKRIESGVYDVIILNFANCDMVGHTGVLEAAVKATEAVDECVKIVYDAVSRMGGTLILTADHGNAEKMSDETGAPFTAHTLSLVPFVICKEGLAPKDGALCDIAPTMLKLLALPQPEAMTGRSLI